MDGSRLNIVYKASLDKLTEINSSFDRGVLRVAYTGKNRNKSYISKATFEKCIGSIYNCPIVCNYDRDTDSIGAHDIEIISDDRGMRIVNVTQPVGVVPESANYWWETVEEDNGDTHEYLCVDVIIWKRQEAYNKIKDNRITDESMEIKVKSGETVDGYYHIDSFEFTAFCLLESAEPCFESACIEVFALNEFKSQYTEMLDEFKKSFNEVNTPNGDDINPQNITQKLPKGGNVSLDIAELLKKYGLSADDLDFDISGLTQDELNEKLKNLGHKFDGDTEDAEGDPSGDIENGDGGSQDATNTDGAEGADAEPGTESGEGDSANDEQDADNDDVNGKSKKDKPSEEFALTGEQFRTELIEALSVESYTDPYWGEMSRYMYVDFDADGNEVYCYDCADWKLYGFAYSLNGDNVVIDFESKKRKKFSVVDFDEGSEDFNYKYAFERFGAAVAASKNAEINSIKAENETLKSYQKSKMDEERKVAEDGLFSRFSELQGIDAFEQLKANCSDLTLEEIESKCFEIKGRNGIANFSINKPKPTRILIDKKASNDEPYGGLFTKFLNK